MEAHYASTYVALYSGCPFFLAALSRATGSSGGIYFIFLARLLHERCIELLLRAALAEHIHNSARVHLSAQGLPLLFHFDAPKEHQSENCSHTNVKLSVSFHQERGFWQKMCSLHCRFQHIDLCSHTKPHFELLRLTRPSHGRCGFALCFSLEMKYACFHDVN
jgi:hypothetical protein